MSSYLQVICGQVALISLLNGPKEKTVLFNGQIILVHEDFPVETEETRKLSG